MQSECLSRIDAKESDTVVENLHRSAYLEEANSKIEDSNASGDNEISNQSADSQAIITVNRRRTWVANFSDDMHKEKISILRVYSAPSKSSFDKFRARASLAGNIIPHKVTEDDHGRFAPLPRQRLHPDDKFEHLQAETSNLNQCIN